MRAATTRSVTFYFEAIRHRRTWIRRPCVCRASLDQFCLAVVAVGSVKIGPIFGELPFAGLLLLVGVVAVEIGIK